MSNFPVDKLVVNEIDIGSLSVIDDNGFLKTTDGQFMVPSSGDENQILIRNSEGKPEWKNNSSTGDAIYYIVKNEDHTATSLEYILCDTLTNGSFTIILPNSPNNFDRIFVLDYKDNCGTDSVFITRNGKTIMGLEEDIEVNVDSYKLGLLYIDGDWRYI